MQEEQATGTQLEHIEPTPLPAPAADSEPPAGPEADPTGLDALMMRAMSTIASLSFSVGIPTTASVAYTLSSALGQITALSMAAGVAYARFWLGVPKHGQGIGVSRRSSQPLKCRDGLVRKQCRALVCSNGGGIPSFALGLVAAEPGACDGGRGILFSREAGFVGLAMNPWPCGRGLGAQNTNAWRQGIRVPSVVVLRDCAPSLTRHLMLPPLPLPPPTSEPDLPWHTLF